MKRKIYLLIIACFSSLFILAQPVLNFETHSLKPGYDNEMSYCNYMDPGPEGENMTWDFSELEFKKVFTGYVEHSADSGTGTSVSGTNIELMEFDSRFYFSVREDRIEQYGYSSSDGTIQTRYTEPFVKMKYPFNYLDVYAGNFAGSVHYSGVERGYITGDYTLEADAWGTLLLPGNISYDNTLRIRTEKSYSYEPDPEQEVHISTYRWYNSIHRYPLLVLTEYSVSSKGHTILNYQAAYNNHAVAGISPADPESILFYPNPAADHLMLEYNAIAAGTLLFTLIDKSGKVISEFEHEVVHSGYQQLNLSDRISSLIPSNYLLVVKNGDLIRSYSLSVTD